jgi:hypothetical protein
MFMETAHGYTLVDLQPTTNESNERSVQGTLHLSDGDSIINICKFNGNEDELKGHIISENPIDVVEYVSLYESPDLQQLDILGYDGISIPDYTKVSVSRILRDYPCNLPSELDSNVGMINHSLVCVLNENLRGIYVELTEGTRFIDKRLLLVHQRYVYIYMHIYFLHLVFYTAIPDMLFLLWFRVRKFSLSYGLIR